MGDRAGSTPVIRSKMPIFIGIFYLSKRNERQGYFMGILLQIVLLIVGFAMLMKGADWFVDGASKVADKLGIPKIVIGLTIVAFGTSAPEAAVSISAALNGSVDLAISNVVGSNILNVLIILGAASIIYPLNVKKTCIKFDIPMVIVITALLLAFGSIDGVISSLEGGIFLILLVAYIAYMIYLTKNGDASADDVASAGENDKLWKLILIALIGGVLIVFGSDITVDAATKIATTFGMSERLIGLTIVAFGTSLPELVTSCMAAKKKETDIAVGNVVGSNIFNILFVLGTTAVIMPIQYISAFVLDNVVAIAVMVILWLFVFKKRVLGRKGGIVFLLMYVVYFVNLLVNTIV